MYYFIYPTTDTTLYENKSDLNSGLDQIIELVKVKETDEDGVIPQVSRILIKFDLSDLSQKRR